MLNWLLIISRQPFSSLAIDASSRFQSKQSLGCNIQRHLWQATTVFIWFVENMTSGTQWCVGFDINIMLHIQDKQDACFWNNLKSVEASLCGETTMLLIHPQFSHIKTRGHYFHFWKNNVPKVNGIFCQDKMLEYAYNWQIRIENTLKFPKTEKILSVSITELILQPKA